MNLNRILYIVTQSILKIRDIEKTYGYSCTNDIKDLLLVIIGYNIIKESDWYNLSEENYNSILDQLNTLIRGNRFFIFNTPINGIYSNTEDIQSSSTFDQILV